MAPSTVGLLDLPSAVLVHILGLLPTTKPAKDLANTRLSCKALRDVALAVPHKPTLAIGSWRLAKAREAGLEGQLLAFLARNANSWRSMWLAVDSEEQQAVLHRLSPAGAVNSGLCSLELYLSPPWPVQQSLTVSASLSGSFRLPAQSLASMRRLTSLHLHMGLRRVPGTNNYVRHSLSVVGGHLAGCTALRRLSLEGIELLGTAPATWVRLEQLCIRHANQDAGFWSAVPQLPFLTSLEAGRLGAAVERSLCSHLPTCTHLVSLRLRLSTVEALPQLSPTLTSLRIDGADHSLRTVPVAPNLRSLKLWWLPRMVWPEGLSAMVHLTTLHTSGPGRQVLPAPLAALPALEDLRLYNRRVTALPDQLACAGALRRLDACGGGLEQVPAVLGGGAACQLAHLSLSGNKLLTVSSEGLEVLRSLTALTCLDVRDACAGGWPTDEDLEAALRPVVPGGCELRVGEDGVESDCETDGIYNSG
ncbi:hypothetical protein N2152v2_010017 [Parachlorella kessleri]